VIPAGARDRKISFHAVATLENALGEPVDSEAYPLLGEEWARIIYGKADERRSAAVEGTNQPATFIVLSNSVTRAITTTNIIQYGGETWDIANISPWGREEIEFTAARRAA
jgi:hypothetical protein